MLGYPRVQYILLTVCRHCTGYASISIQLVCWPNMAMIWFTAGPSPQMAEGSLIYLFYFTYHHFYFPAQLVGGFATI